jgi:hypothetical protein
MSHQWPACYCIVYLTPFSSPEAPNGKNQALPLPGAHACNPSYSGGRDKEDFGFEASPGK